MAQQLRALAPLLEDLSSIPSNFYNSTSGNQTLFWPPWVPGTHWSMQAKNPYIQNFFLKIKTGKEPTKALQKSTEKANYCVLDS